MSIRHIFILTTVVGIAVAVSIPIYKYCFPRTITLPTPTYLFDESPDSVLNQIRDDLDLKDEDFSILELTTADRKELGIREEAILQSNAAGTYTLRYVYRVQNTSKSKTQRWQVWTNSVTIEDGTGAEEPAIEEFDQEPTVEQVAAFKAKTIRHSGSQ